MIIETSEDLKSAIKQGEYNQRVTAVVGTQTLHVPCRLDYVYNCSRTLNEVAYERAVKRFNKCVKALMAATTSKPFSLDNINPTFLIPWYAKVSRKDIVKQDAATIEQALALANQLPPQQAAMLHYMIGE